MKTWLKTLLYLIPLVLILFWNWRLQIKLQNIEESNRIYQDSITVRTNILEHELKELNNKSIPIRKEYEKVKIDIIAPIDSVDDRELWELLNRFERRLYQSKEDNTSYITGDE